MSEHKALDSSRRHSKHNNDLHYLAGFEVDDEHAEAPNVSLSGLFRNLQYLSREGRRIKFETSTESPENARPSLPATSWRTRREQHNHRAYLGKNRSGYSKTTGIEETLQAEPGTPGKTMMTERSRIQDSKMLLSFLKTSDKEMQSTEKSNNNNNRFYSPFPVSGRKISLNIQDAATSHSRTLAHGSSRNHSVGNTNQSNLDGRQRQHINFQNRRAGYTTVHSSESRSNISTYSGNPVNQKNLRLRSKFMNKAEKEENIVKTIEFLKSLKTPF